MDAAIGLLGMLLLMALGAPIFVSLGLTAILMIAMEGRPLMDAAAHSINGINSTTFLAVPFFVMAATFMQRGGIARIIIEAAEAWVGHMRGGLGLVAVIATTLLQQFQALLSSRPWRWALSSFRRWWRAAMIGPSRWALLGLRARWVF